MDSEQRENIRGMSHGMEAQTQLELEAAAEFWSKSHQRCAVTVTLKWFLGPPGTQGLAAGLRVQAEEVASGSQQQDRSAKANQGPRSPSVVLVG